jgi:fatty acid-binding protein DegV
MAPDTLVHLKNGGRISKMEYIAGSMLKIKPIITGYKGSITEEKHGIKNSKARGTEKA